MIAITKMTLVIHSLLSQKITLFVIIFLMAEVFMTFIGAWREIVEQLSKM